jgi:hypothetical protein
MNDDNPGRRGATKIDGELPTCAQKARPKPQIAAARRLTDWSGPSEACLIRRTDALLLSRSRHLGNLG